MKPIIKFLVRLYPSACLKRHGAELDALLEDATPSVGDAFDLFWGALKMQMTTWDFAKVTFACSVAGVLLAVAAASSSSPSALRLLEVVDRTHNSPASCQDGLRAIDVTNA